MTRYEDLQGAIGRAVYFRPDRIDPKQHFPRSALRARFGNEEFRIIDMSVSGVGLSGVSAIKAGARDKLEIFCEGQTVFSGDAEVCWADANLRRTRLGLRLMRAPLDISGIKRVLEVLSLEHLLIRPCENTPEPIPEAYRLRVMDMITLLRRHRDALDPLDADQTILQSMKLEALARIEEGILPRYCDIWYDLNDIVAQVGRNSPAFHAIKAFTESVLTPEYLASPMWRRAYEKPLGYPGDYRLMRYVYEPDLPDMSLYGKLMHSIGLYTAQCIYERMARCRKMIETDLKARTNGEPLMITNIGAGPAQEIYDLVAADTIAGPLHATLLDQDSEALQFSYERLHPHLLRHGGAAHVGCLNASFTDLLRNGRLQDHIPPQDVIYSLGLIDYFTQSTAKRLVRNLYNRLKPGGRLIICNMKAGRRANFWPLEFLCDWTLEYRDHAQMLDFLSGTDAVDIEVEPEKTGRVWMLSARKPG